MVEDDALATGATVVVVVGGGVMGLRPRSAQHGYICPIPLVWPDGPG
jgi:hypothetical protein